MSSSKTALVVIDVQEGFRDLTWGVRNNMTAEDNVARLLAEWRRIGAPVHHVQHSSKTAQGTFVRGSAGFAFMPQAEPWRGEPVHVKEVNSAFIGTGLEAALRADGVDTLVIVGLTTPHCVSTTARMAANLAFNTYVVEDATAAFARPGLDGVLRSADEVHATALSDLSGEFATIISTQSVPI